MPRSKINYIFDSENRRLLRLGNKNKQAYFVLLSACVIFDSLKNII